MKPSMLLAGVLLLSAGPVWPQKYSAFVNAGEKAMQQGDYYSALLYFEQAQAFETGDMRLHFNMAESSRLFNDYYGAAYWYNQVVLADKEKRYPLALYWLAMMNKMQGEYEPAKNLFYRYYTAHQADSDYYSRRAGAEVDACEQAYQAMKDTLPVDIRNMGSDVNTVYSDFAAQQTSDSALVFSSLRFEVDNPETQKPDRYVTRLLRSDGRKRGRHAYATPLDTLFNVDTLHNANSAFSSDNRVMVFARCTPLSYSDMQCALYISWNTKGTWSPPRRLNDSINLPGYTNTQPCIAQRGALGYTLYFSSDRPGGYGKLDLYRADFTTDGTFSPAVNLGPAINTGENEVTPFFHNTSQILFFSSDRPEGLGGYDVFSSMLTADTFALPAPVGYPVNTGCNDLYYTRSETEDRGYLSSNRPGSLYIKARTCCYDIYAWKGLAPPKKKPDTAAVQVAAPPPIVVARQLLPLVLYFHNDEPDPKTLRTTTRSDYRQLYEAYLALKPEYEARYAEGLTGEKAGAARQAIDRLFEEKITAGYQRLDRFAGLLLEELRDDKVVKITVRGQASPLAKADYNVNLSRRRISSFLNFLMRYEEGAVEEYVKSGRLTIEEVGAGETLARESVSDDLADKRNSVYSPAAALERKIEVIDVKAEPAQ